MNTSRCLHYISHSVGAVVGIEQTHYTVIENVGAVEVCAVVFSPDISCPIEFSFSIQVTVTDRTTGTLYFISQSESAHATSYNSGYFTVPAMEYDETLMFAVCETRKCVAIAVTDDQADEPDEAINIHLGRTADLHPQIDLSPVDGEILVVDDDGEQKNIHSNI